jgi:hypothetical protein
MMVISSQPYRRDHRDVGWLGRGVFRARRVGVEVFRREGEGG